MVRIRRVSAEGRGALVGKGFLTSVQGVLPSAEAFHSIGGKNNERN
jgi:hypothetical protein